MKYLLKNTETGDIKVFDTNQEIYEYLNINGRYFRRTMKEIQQKINRNGKRFQSLKKYVIIKVPSREWDIYTNKTDWKNKKKDYEKSKEIYIRLYKLLH